VSQPHIGKIAVANSQLVYFFHVRQKLKPLVGQAWSADNPDGRKQKGHSAKGFERLRPASIINRSLLFFKVDFLRDDFPILPGIFGIEH